MVVGILTKDKNLLFFKIDELLNIANLRYEWNLRREKMIDETIDLSKYIIWLYENYPQSIKKIQEEPNFIKEFK